MNNWETKYIGTVTLGDSRIELKEIPDNSVHLILTSPPYYTYQEYEKFDSYEEFLELLFQVIPECERILKPGRHLLINMADAHHKIDNDGTLCFPTHAILTNFIFYKTSLRYKDTIIWPKIRAAHQRSDGSNVLYGSYPYPCGIPIKDNQEFLLVAKKKGKAKYPNKEEKEPSKISWDFFSRYGVTPWPSIHAEMKRIHPAPFPKDFASACIKMFSFVDEIVLDPFAGWGTTAVMAKELGRKFIVIEIMEKYHKMAVQRLRQEVLDFY